MSDIDTRAKSALAAYELGEVELARIDAGLINRTFAVTARRGRFVLQWVNPIFGAEVHLDIEAVTAHLEACGLVTPRLVRTRAGELWTRDAEGGVWRLMTFVEGVTHARAETPALCESAGLLVGRFHAALCTLRHAFQHRRPHVHDTPRHLGHLGEVLRTHASRPAFREVEPLGREILARAAALPSLGTLPPRIVHGDLKLNNVVFSAAGEAVALVDLDTLAEMSIPLELGDALRSWCNPRGEEASACVFEAGHLEAALVGYNAAAGALLAASEIDALTPAIETISLELAARFAADALEETYFGWDRTRFTRAREHNLLRAQSQLSLARSLATQRRELAAVVDRTLRR